MKIPMMKIQATKSCKYHDTYGHVMDEKEALIKHSTEKRSKHFKKEERSTKQEIKVMLKKSKEGAQKEKVETC